MIPRLSVALLTTLLATALHAELTLVENGEPRAVIVTADRPTRLVAYAVEELRDHVQRATGAELPVVKEGKLKQSDTRTRITVGDCSIARTAGFETTALPPETIVVRTVGNALILIGGDRIKGKALPTDRTPAGTLHAVYDFLRKELQVRWLWPGETGRVVPKRPTIQIDTLDRRFQPPLIQRNIRNGMKDATGEVAQMGFTPQRLKAYAAEYRRWALRRGIGRRASFRFGHAYNNWLGKYGKEHPEWFAMMPDGTRVTPEKPYPSEERAKLCVTNPELLDFIAEKGVEYLEAHPTVLSFTACPNDSRGYCMCPKCKALDPPEGLPTQMNYPGQNFMYPSLSDRYVWFWNQLAKRMGDRCPDRYIGAYAYSNYNHPPLREKLSPRVIIGYVGFNYLDAEYNARSREDWAGWARTGCKLYLRPNLLLAGHGFPLNYARKLGRDVQQCYKTGMLGTDFDSMTHQYAAQAPIFHVLTALLWNPEADVDALYGDFMTTAYGSASVQMRSYWDRLETLTNTIADFKEGDIDHDRTPKFHKFAPVFYSPQVLAELRTLLAAARTAARDDDSVLARIDTAAVAVDYAEIQTRVLTAVRQYTKKTDNLQPLADLLQRKRQFFQAHLDDFTLGVHHVYWREGRSTRHRRMYGTNLLNDLAHPRELARLIPWRFRKDPDGVGETKNWQAPKLDDSAWTPITTLTFWEQQAPGKYDGFGWYRTNISVPKAWAKQKKISILFGAVDESFRLYIDGRRVHESLYDPAVDPDIWKKPRVVDITKDLKPGQTQTLAVRVHDSGGAGGIWKPVFIIHD
ncbi:MAG: DUF4838 domain-containing protein [Lentisphaeria bacterium]|nr:DUF4838 domain-containing protein [Lentisphaeria bacterium]